MIQAVTKARRIQQCASNLEAPVETAVEVKEEHLVEMVTTIAPRQITTTAVTRLRTRMETRLMTAITLLAEEDLSVDEMTARTATAYVDTAVTPLSTDGTIAYFAYRTREATICSMLMLHRSVSLAWCTQEDIAFPAETEIGSTTPLGDTAAVFVDTAASPHVVAAGSRVCQHVTDKIDCDVRLNGSCDLSSATSKGTLAFRARNDRRELVAIHREVLIVPDLGASVFSIGVLQDKGVRLDLLSNPPVLRHDNAAFPISTKVPRMFVLHIFLDGKEEPQLASPTTVDTDTWQRRMSPCRLRALKQPAEELTARQSFIDRSGAETSSDIGY